MADHKIKATVSRNSGGNIVYRYFEFGNELPGKRFKAKRRQTVEWHCEDQTVSPPVHDLGLVRFDGVAGNWPFDSAVHDIPMDGTMNTVGTNAAFRSYKYSVQIGSNRWDDPEIQVDEIGLRKKFVIAGVVTAAVALVIFTQIMRRQSNK